MNQENAENLLSPRKQQPPQYQPSVNFQSPRGKGLSPPPPQQGGGGLSNRSAAAENESFARGGNGIFGEPIVSARGKGVVFHEMVWLL